jgi:Glycosyl transferase family 2
VGRNRQRLSLPPNHRILAGPLNAGRLLCVCGATLSDVLGLSSAFRKIVTSLKAAGHGRKLQGLTATTVRLHGTINAVPLSTSIVLCTYNGARFLEAQWNSLFVQSRLPDEIVVRDDASSDTTLTVLEKLRARDEARGVGIRIMRNPQNLGYVANFEAVLRDASGDVVFLCDQDDIWHPDKLVTLVGEFERRPGLLLLCSDARRIDVAGEDLQRSLFDVLRVSRRELQRIHAGLGFAVLLRRSLATGATVALRRTLLADALPFPAGWVHDEWLAIVAAALGGFDCVERSLIDYRQHGGNQLGMSERDLAEKWRDLLRPQAARFGALVARNEVLRERLGVLDGRVHWAEFCQVDENLAHLRARLALKGAVWRRTGTVLREAACGRYRRHATGWRSMLRDLLRRE